MKDKNELLRNKEYKKINIKHITLLLIFNSSGYLILAYFIYMYFFMNIVAVRWALILFTIFTVERIIKFWSKEHYNILNIKYEDERREYEDKRREYEDKRKEYENDMEEFEYYTKELEYYIKELEYNMKENELNIKETNNLREQLKFRIDENNKEHKLYMDQQRILYDKINEISNKTSILRNKVNMVKDKVKILKDKLEKYKNKNN